MVPQVFLHLIFNVERQSVLQEATHLAPVLAVSVADRKEVAVFQAHDVGRRDVGVLVCLVGVVCCYSAFGCKGELGHHVADLLHFLALRLVLIWRSYVCGRAVFSIWLSDPVGLFMGQHRVLLLQHLGLLWKPHLGGVGHYCYLDPLGALTSLAEKCSACRRCGCLALGVVSALRAHWSRRWTVELLVAPEGSDLFAGKVELVLGEALVRHVPEHFRALDAAPTSSCRRGLLA
jgi:hypothetical protein